MVRSLDNLISFLLDEIALCGEEGMSLTSLFSVRPLNYIRQPILLFLYSRHPCPDLSTVPLPREYRWRALTPVLLNITTVAQKMQFRVHKMCPEFQYGHRKRVHVKLIS